MSIFSWRDQGIWSCLELKRIRTHQNRQVGARRLSRSNRCGVLPVQGAILASHSEASRGGAVVGGVVTGVVTGVVW